uniref:hypothetical protein n=1 Tax=Weissella confusa TaxID=1583 RepID=UPI0022E7C138
SAISLQGREKSVRKSSIRALNVRFVNYQIGRIKLVGNKTKMQIPLDLENVEWIEDRSLVYYIEQLPRWFDYLDLITDDMN